MEKLLEKIVVLDKVYSVPFFNRRTYRVLKQPLPKNTSI